MAVLILQGSLVAESDKVNLIPLPREMEFLEGKFIIGSDLGIEVKGPPSKRVTPVKRHFLKRLAARTGIFFSLEPENYPIRIAYKRTVKLSPVMDESYSLKVSKKDLILSANTDVGILRGMETLLQLLRSDGKGYYFPAVEVRDEPRFYWRGLLQL